MAASTGIRSEPVAVLLVISVRKVTPSAMHSTIIQGGSVASAVSCVATASLRPVSMKPLAIVMPPANRISTPQGMLPAVSQSSRRVRLPSFLPSGMQHSATTASIATAASLA